MYSALHARRFSSHNRSFCTAEPFGTNWPTKTGACGTGIAEKHWSLGFRAYAHASPGIRLVTHPVFGTVISFCKANWRCEPQHVLQRPRENNACLHTAGSHSLTMPLSTKRQLVPRLAFPLPFLFARRAVPFRFAPFLTALLPYRHYAAVFSTSLFIIFFSIWVEAVTRTRATTVSTTAVPWITSSSFRTHWMIYRFMSTMRAYDVLVKAFESSVAECAKTPKSWLHIRSTERRL